MISPRISTGSVVTFSSSSFNFLIQEELCPVYSMFTRYSPGLGNVLCTHCLLAIPLASAIPCVVTVSLLYPWPRQCPGYSLFTYYSPGLDNLCSHCLRTITLASAMPCVVTVYLLFPWPRQCPVYSLFTYYSPGLGNTLVLTVYLLFPWPRQCPVYSMFTLLVLNFAGI